MSEPVEIITHTTTDLVHPLTGTIVNEQSLDDLADWYRTIIDLENERLRPAKRRAAEAIYNLLDQEGIYTQHTTNPMNPLVVTGESVAAYENQVTTDNDALYRDLTILRERAHPLPELATATFALDWRRDITAWVDEFFKTTRTITTAGKNRLQRMSNQYASTLALHTTDTPPEERRARKAPTITRQ